MPASFCIRPARLALGTCLTLVLSIAGLQNAEGDSTFVYAVQISAQVQTSPPRITLNWVPDPYGATSYVIFRKRKDDWSWGSGTWLGGDQTSFTDANVNIGDSYEYQIIKSGALGYFGYGYIFAGLEAPSAENRGKLVLVTARESLGDLSFEVDRLQTDFVGDGWQVVRLDVSINDTPEAVRGAIRSLYQAEPGNVKAVFLLGHVPVPLSGFLEYDSHGQRAMPADAFYGEMDSDWRTGSGSPNFLPSDVDLMVGRVDFADMPGQGSSVPWPSERELLRNYLRKDHEWRHKILQVQRRGLVANRVGDYSAQAPATSGYRNFTALMGAGSILEANVQDAAPVNERWISVVSGDTYLWTYGCGGGQPNAISQLGFHGLYNDVWSTDIVNLDAKAAFVMLFGSSVGDWQKPDNILRAVLATHSVGLASCMAGRPHWFFHHMGLGEPIGYSARLTMNNSTMYMNQSNYFTRAVYIALMGDPTLRMDVVAPPSNLAAGSGNGWLSWGPSADSIRGYHVYRSQWPLGPFSRLTDSPVTGTSFQDSTVASGTYTYMVRAVALQTGASGSYWNLSQGAFVTAQVTGGTVPSIHLSAFRSGRDVVLSWTSQPGATYRVMGADRLKDAYWTDVSGTVVASSSQTFWTDPQAGTLPLRFYYVVSP